MATLQPSPPFSHLPKETNYEYRSAGDDTTSGVRRSAGDERRVRPLLSGWGDYHEYTRYSPSILVVSDNSAGLTQLTQWLESKGCQVYGLNINSTTLASVSQIYFDLIVVDLDSFERVSSKSVVQAAGVAGVPTVGEAPTEREGKTGASANEDLFVLLQKLKAYPGLSILPTIILTNCDETRTSITNSIIGPVYCLSKGPSTEAILLQIVAQIHYLSYRYI